MFVRVVLSIAKYVELIRGEPMLPEGSVGMFIPIDIEDIELAGFAQFIIRQ